MCWRRWAAEPATRPPVYTTFIRLEQALGMALFDITAARVFAGARARGAGSPLIRATIAVGSLITATIPPRIGLILYGFRGNVSIGQLFAAGVILGPLMTVFLKSTVIALLLTPILVPVVTRLGIDPVHFGLVMMTCVTLGSMTPPVGVAMFIVCGMLDWPVDEHT
jgi:TRAP-type C4-dicarboxylate transport system permease large subunit